MENHTKKNSFKRKYEENSQPLKNQRNTEGLDVADAMWNSEHINSYRINRKMVYPPNTYFFEVKNVQDMLRSRS